MSFLHVLRTWITSSQQRMSSAAVILAVVAGLALSMTTPSAAMAASQTRLGVTGAVDFENGALIAAIEDGGSPLAFRSSPMNVAPYIPLEFVGMHEFDPQIVQVRVVLERRAFPSAGGPAPEWAEVESSPTQSTRMIYDARLRSQRVSVPSIDFGASLGAHPTGTFRIVYHLTWIDDEAGHTLGRAVFAPNGYPEPGVRGMESVCLVRTVDCSAVLAGIEIR
jgi:hypothetical protein